MIRVTVAVLAASVGLVVVSSPVSAQEGCVHRSDFRQVEASALTDSPMSRWQAHQVFGTNGRDIGYNTRVYRGCGVGSRAWVQFELVEGIYRASSTAFTWTYFGDGLTTLQPARTKEER